VKFARFIYKILFLKYLENHELKSSEVCALYFLKNQDG